MKRFNRRCNTSEQLESRLLLAADISLSSVSVVIDSQASTEDVTETFLDLDLSRITDGGLAVSIRKQGSPSREPINARCFSLSMTKTPNPIVQVVDCDEQNIRVIHGSGSGLANENDRH